MEKFLKPATFWIIALCLACPFGAQANTCENYFRSRYTTSLERLSEQEYNTLVDLAKLELEIYAEKNPSLKNFKLLQLQSDLNEVVESGIDIQVYWRVLKAVTDNQFLKDQLSSEKFAQQQQDLTKHISVIKELEKQEKKYLEYYKSQNITEALFQAFKSLKEKPNREPYIHEEHITDILSSEFLLNRVDIHAQFTYTQQTLLHSAAAAGHAKAVTILIKHGAKIEALDSAGQTPLHYAAFEVKLQVVQTLLQFKAQINAANNNKLTPLHVASMRPILQNQAEVVQTLLSYKADVNAVTNLGFTPLHYAAQNGFHIKSISLLLLNGANIKARTLENKTPLQLAIEKEEIEAIEFLRENGAEE